MSMKHLVIGSELVFSLVVLGCSGEVGGTDANNGGGSDSGSQNPPNDGPPADVPGGVGEPPEMQGMTLLHNQVRAAVQTNTPLPPLTWSSSLAATAAAWVAQCQDTQAPSGLVDHNPGRSTGHPYYVGENIYASGGTATPAGAVQLWAAEEANFTYPTGCSGVCGHYTQIVWRTTLEVGCALGNCPGLTYPSTIVCNYGPGGNSGGAPY